MQQLPLPAACSEQLTRDVIAYQRNPANTDLGMQIHNMTQLLLYALPSYLHILDEEECCEFLFFCYGAIETYVTTFREGRLSYVGYITQVVRKRSKFFIAHKKQENRREQIVLENEGYESSAEDDFMVAESKSYVVFKEMETSPLGELPELFNGLLCVQPCSTIPPTKALALLKQQLQNQVNRRRFLIMLIIAPHLASDYLLEDLAGLLEVDPALLGRYLNTASRLLVQKEDCRKTFEIISNRHFRRLLEIQEERQRCFDENKMARLKQLESWTEKAYKAKVEQIRAMELHLSHSQIGKALNIPKGTIDSSVHYMKRLIQSCLDEKNDNEYL